MCTFSVGPSDPIPTRWILSRSLGVIPTPKSNSYPFIYNLYSLGSDSHFLGFIPHSLVSIPRFIDSNFPLPWIRSPLLWIQTPIPLDPIPTHWIQSPSFATNFRASDPIPTPIGSNSYPLDPIPTPIGSNPSSLDLIPIPCFLSSRLGFNPHPPVPWF